MPRLCLYYHWHCLTSACTRVFVEICQFFLISVKSLDTHFPWTYFGIFQANLPPVSVSFRKKHISRFHSFNGGTERWAVFLWSWISKLACCCLACTCKLVVVTSIQTMHDSKTNQPFWCVVIQIAMLLPVQFTLKCLLVMDVRKWQLNVAISYFLHPLRSKLPAQKSLRSGRHSETVIFLTLWLILQLYRGLRCEACNDLYFCSQYSMKCHVVFAWCLTGELTMDVLSQNTTVCRRLLFVRMCTYVFFMVFCARLTSQYPVMISWRERAISTCNCCCRTEQQGENFQ